MFHYLFYKYFSKAFTAFIFTPFVLASGLYPTQPVVNTTFHGNRNNTVMWQGGEGTWMLNLMIGNDIYLYTLAEEVTASTGRQSVYIPPYVGADSDQYYLKFVPQHDTKTTEDVYTTRFALDSMNGPSYASVDLSASQYGEDQSANVTSSAASSASSSVLPTTSASTFSPTTRLPTGGGIIASAACRIILTTFPYLVCIILGTMTLA